MTSDRTGSPAGTAKEKLLDRCVEFLARHGFGDLSLREIAAGVGTSHRMLIYHFGGRDELLAEVVGRVEAQTRAGLVALAEQIADPLEMGRAFWRSLADPSLAPAERLFFEIYANALYGRPWTESFRASVIAAWTGPVEELFRRLGFSAEESALRTRIGLALTRGLLLDLLLTGDRHLLDDAAELFGRLLVRPLPPD
jgi:AcrR family transcriptional regulator